MVTTTIISIREYDTSDIVYSSCPMFTQVLAFSVSYNIIQRDLNVAQTVLGMRLLKVSLHLSHRWCVGRVDWVVLLLPYFFVFRFLCQYRALGGLRCFAVFPRGAVGHFFDMNGF